MAAFASLICGYIFGWGLLVSGMIQPTKVLGFLDFFGIPSGAWDPSLAVVMAAGLSVAGVGYALIRGRAPLLVAQSLWPTRRDIDGPLVAGAILFGIGWGLVGLCPGPAIANLGSLAPGVIVFVITMAIGMAAHDMWQARATSHSVRELTPATAADG
jgi:hypothetical protein